MNNKKDRVFLICLHFIPAVNSSNNNRVFPIEASSTGSFK